MLQYLLPHSILKQHLCIKLRRLHCGWGDELIEKLALQLSGYLEGKPDLHGQTGMIIPTRGTTHLPAIAFPICLPSWMKCQLENVVFFAAAVAVEIHGNRRAQSPSFCNTIVTLAVARAAQF